MGPRPFDILQKSTPSASALTFADVQSAGLGLSAAAATPSPLPPGPWHVTQFVSALEFGGNFAGIQPEVKSNLLAAGGPVAPGGARPTLDFSVKAGTLTEPVDVTKYLQAF